MLAQAVGLSWNKHLGRTANVAAGLMGNGMCYSGAVWPGLWVTLEVKMERSYEKITKNDLLKLLSISRVDIASFFERNPGYIDDYRGKEKLIALGQGAALHYLDGVNGVKDFDIWFFYPEGSKQFPYRRRGVADFGKSKFSVHPNDKGFSGRRVDVLMRSDANFNHGAPEKCLRGYLEAGRTGTARQLAAKAFVGLHPEKVLGKALWPL